MSTTVSTTARATRFVGDTALLTGRSLRHITRSVDTIITTVLIPIALMLLFVFVFGGAIDTGGAAPIDYMTPGILLITVASGISYTSYRLFLDLAGGIVERFRSMPIARSAFLWSHVATSMAANGLSLVIVMAVAVACGFRSGAGVLPWLGVAGIVLLFTLALTWLAVVAGLGAKTVDGAGAFAYPLIFLPFLSSAFVPTATMPAAVRWFAQYQPVTPMVDGIRALLSGTPVGPSLWIAAAWCVGILVVAFFAATALYRRRVR